MEGSALTASARGSQKKGERRWRRRREARESGVEGRRREKRDAGGTAAGLSEWSGAVRLTAPSLRSELELKAARIAMADGCDNATAVRTSGLKRKKKCG